MLAWFKKGSGTVAGTARRVLRTPLPGQVGQQTITIMGTGHHGGDRELPYINCAPCHGDPVTGILTGNDFGSLFAPSCFECHADNKWAGDDIVQPTWGTPPVEGIVLVKGKPTLDGTVGELVRFQANATDNEGDPPAYTWSFDDGSPAQFPSFENVTSHAY